MLRSPIILRLMPPDPLQRYGMRPAVTTAVAEYGGVAEDIGVTLTASAKVGGVRGVTLTELALRWGNIHASRCT